MDWGILLPFLGAVVGGCLGGYLTAYGKKKGENLATKEDIQAITESQKSVEHQFNLLLEQSKHNHSLQTLVASERLAAHQKAFALLQKLYRQTKDMDEKVISECKEWLDNNCLYLSEKSRRDFYGALVVYKKIKNLFEINKKCVENLNKSQHNSDILNENNRRIEKINELLQELYEKCCEPKSLFEDVELPPLGDKDKEQLKELNPSPPPTTTLCQP